MTCVIWLCIVAIANDFLDEFSKVVSLCFSCHLLFLLGFCLLRLLLYSFSACCQVLFAIFLGFFFLPVCQCILSLHSLNPRPFRPSPMECVKWHGPLECRPWIQKGHWLLTNARHGSIQRASCSWPPFQEGHLPLCRRLRRSLWLP